MHNERRYFNQLNFINISKPILNKILQETASILLNNISNGSEARHQKKTSWFSETSQMSSRSSANASAKNQNIFFINTKHFIDIIKYV